MERRQCIDTIIAKEWEMFRAVNGENRVECQEDPHTFEVMRRAQYDAWDDVTLSCYIEDLRKAETEGRNLVREKYIRMMETTEPSAWTVLRAELPVQTEKQKELTEAIWTKTGPQTIKLHTQYPALAGGGRPVVNEEGDAWASVETYQKGELATYSEETLVALFNHIRMLEEKGRAYAFCVQENMVRAYGYSSLEEAETAMAGRKSE